MGNYSTENQYAMLLLSVNDTEVWLYSLVTHIISSPVRCLIKSISCNKRFDLASINIIKILINLHVVLIWCKVAITQT